MAATHYQIFCRYYHSFVNRAVINDLNDTANLYEWVSGENKSLSKLASDYKPTPVQKNIPVIKLVMSDGSIKWYTLKDLSKVNSTDPRINIPEGYKVGDYEDLREIIFDEATGKTVEDVGDTRTTMYPTPSISLQNGEQISLSSLVGEYESIEAQLVVLESSRNTLTTEITAAESEVESKSSIKDAKESIKNTKDTAVETAEAAVTAATEAYNLAPTEEKEAKLALLEQAQAALETATSEYSAALAEYETALTNLATAESNLAAKRIALTNVNNSITELNREKANLDTKIVRNTSTGEWSFKQGASTTYIGIELTTGVIASIYTFKMITENISVFSSKNMTESSYFYNLEENGETYKKLFFSLSDYENKREAIENIWIRFEDCLLAPLDDAIEASKEQLKNIKNARKLDTTLNEISIRENVATNPKFDMIFLYDGLSTETAAPIKNYQGKSYNTWARKWSDAKEDIRNIPKKVRDGFKNGQSVTITEVDDFSINDSVCKIPKYPAWYTSLADIETYTYDPQLTGRTENELAISGIYSTIENPFEMDFTKEAKIIKKKTNTQPDFTLSNVCPVFVRKYPNKPKNMKMVILFLTREDLEMLWAGTPLNKAIYEASNKFEEEGGDDGDENNDEGTNTFDPDILYMQSTKTQAYGFADIFLPNTTDEMFYFEDTQTEVSEDFELEESQNVVPYVYYEKFKRFELSPWFVYSNCGSLKYALTKAEELVGIMGIDNVMIGKVVDLTQYIEIA